MSKRSRLAEAGVLDVLVTAHRAFGEHGKAALLAVVGSPPVPGLQARAVTAGAEVAWFEVAPAAAEEAATTGGEAQG
jgi:hypothetical protein